MGVAVVVLEDGQAPFPSPIPVFTTPSSSFWLHPHYIFAFRSVSFPSIPAYGWKKCDLLCRTCSRACFWCRPALLYV